jgi:multiple sugar transport system substrate-binding protein
MIELTGITWDHSRALPPLVATAQRYEELHPGARIRWEKRSLHEFGHMPVDVLAQRFDLVVIDHPWAGFAFAHGLFHDLAPLLTEAQHSDLEKNSVGPSFKSYLYEGKLLAVPIDAATPTPSWRPDLLQAARVAVPERWSDVVALADQGLAIMPGFPADLYLNFHMLCAALGGQLFADRERLVDRQTGEQALAMLLRLAKSMPAEIFAWNPIRVSEILTTSDRFAFCPFAYSYGNYCRPHFAAKQLRYGRLVTLDDGRPLHSVVGGTGIAISARCKSIETALDYALFTGSASVQQGIYAMAGGQPSRIEAWADSHLNDACGGFFSAAQPDQQACIVRPRYNGYVPLQEQAGEPLGRYLRGEIEAIPALDAVDAAFRSSLPPGPNLPTL